MEEFGGGKVGEVGRGCEEGCELWGGRRVSRGLFGGRRRKDGKGWRKRGHVGSG